MSWQFFILTSLFLASFSTLVQRYLMKDEKSDPVAYSVFFQLAVGILVGIYGYFFTKMSFPKFGDVGYAFLLMMFLYAFGWMAEFKSIKQIEASKFSILFSTRVIFTTLASFLFLREVVGFSQLIGILFVLSGVVLVSLKAKKFQISSKGSIALVAAALFGFANTTDKYLLDFFNVIPYVSLGFIAPGLLTIFLQPSVARRMRVFIDKQLIKKMGVLVVLVSAQAITFTAALQLAPLSSQVVTIYSAQVVLIVILSAILLKERRNLRRKILGAMAAFIGIVLLT